MCAPPAPRTCAARPSSRSTRRWTSDKPAARRRRLPRRLRWCVPTPCRVRSTWSVSSCENRHKRGHVAATHRKTQTICQCALLPSAVTACSCPPRPLRGVDDNGHGFAPAAANLLHVRRRRDRSGLRCATPATCKCGCVPTRMPTSGSGSTSACRVRADKPCASASSTPASATYVDGWRGYQAVASYDRDDWFRVPTTFDGSELAIAHEPRATASTTRTSSRTRGSGISRCSAPPMLRRARGCATSARRSKGRDLNLVDGRRSRRRAQKSIWVIARQHPGETMAEWFVEGMLERLLDPADPVARRVLERAVDPHRAQHESRRQRARQPAHQRCRRQSQSRMAGAFARSAVRRCSTCAPRCRRWAWTRSSTCTATKACLTCSPTATSDCRRIRRAWRRWNAGFAGALAAANPISRPCTAIRPTRKRRSTSTVASKWVGHTYGGLALTLEMPFKDNADLPDPLRGWSGARSRRLGADTLTALYAMLPSL